MTSVSAFNNFGNFFSFFLLIWMWGCGLSAGKKEIFPPEFFLDGFKISCHIFERENWIELESPEEIARSRCSKVFAVARILNVHRKFSLRWLWLNEDGQEIKKSFPLTINEEQAALKVISAQDSLELTAVKPGAKIRVLLFLNDRLMAEESFLVVE